MARDRDILLRIAGDVADGASVDWDQESLRHRSFDDELKRLRQLQAIALAHRSPISAIPTGRPQTDLTVARTAPVLERWRWGKLEVLERLGGGNFGEVYRAHDPDLQKHVALKLPRLDREGEPADGRRFLDEARRLARVRHPNVLRVHGVEEHGGRTGIWTDLVEGQTLEQVLRSQGPFGPGEAGVIGLSLCRALAAVHRAGLIHRDVKTDNIMREKGGQIILMDFNVVAERLPGESEAGDDSLSGTPSFMAPELFEGRSASVASDIYAVGVVLYRLVTGRFPVEAASLKELRRKHADRAAVPLIDARPDLPAAFARTVSRALAREPDQRFPSAGALESALTVASGLEPGPHHQSPPNPAPGPRLRWGLAAAPAGLLVAAVLLALWMSGGPVHPGPLEASASLFRVRPGAEERLLAGSRISPGDQLFLEIQGSEAMHVYVLNESAGSPAVVLFPLPGLAKSNPLPGGVAHRLPGPMQGELQFWNVDSAGGRETVLVIASREKLEGLEEKLATFARAGAGEPFAVPRDDMELALRGIAGLSPRRPGGGAPAAVTSKLTHLLREISRPAAGRQGLFFWELSLENPAPGAPPLLPEGS